MIDKPDIEQLRRAAVADSEGYCAVCAYITGELVKATQKAHNDGKWTNLCTYHARHVRQARMDEARKGRK